MSDKLQSASIASCVLPDIAVVTLSGRDCIAFAQAQFMSDVARLVDGAWHWSGWLTPKGRVVALFAALRHSAERLDLVVLDADPTALASSLKHYVFRSKVTIEARGDLCATGSFQADDGAHGAVAAIDAAGATLDFGVPAHPRRLRLHAPVSGPVAVHDASAQARWRAVDMTHGLPRLGDDQREHWTPQQLSLERLRAFSVAKGCYPGQEIVARTHFLGKAKRGLMALRGLRGAVPGTDVTTADRPLGRVVCAADDLALAVMPLDLPETPLRISGHDVVQTPLQDGLAR